MGPATTATLSGLPDPIFAAVETHKQANADWSGAMARHNAELEKLGPGHLDEEASTFAESEAAGDREGKAYSAFWKTSPTTIAGMAAYFQYLQSPRWPRDDDPSEATIIDYLATEDGPEIADWARTVELALRRIAATA
jgi:hypothetical protein